MKLKLNFTDLEAQWKERQLDLFPWLQGLLALLRSREANLKETRKRLASSTLATMVQFLSSFDPETAKIARQIIKEQDPSDALPLLLYSLEKTNKNNYPHRVMKCLLDFNPTISFGYLLGYLHVRQTPKLEKNQSPKPEGSPDLIGEQIKKAIFQVISEIFCNLNTLFPSSQGKDQFLSQIFEALSVDLKERMPLLSIVLETWDDFEAIKLDLEVILSLFSKTKYEEYAQIIEEKIRELGQEIIISLHKIPFESEKGATLFEHLQDIIHYMAIMRLEVDKQFLQSMPEKIHSFELSEKQKNEIIQKSEAAVKIIDQPETTIQKILDELETPFFI